MTLKVLCAGMEHFVFALFRQPVYVKAGEVSITESFRPTSAP